MKHLRLFLLISISLLGSSTVLSAQAPTEIVEYYGTDAIGSVRVVFDAAGNITGRMDYTPFGTEISSGAGLPSRRFAELFRDGENGLDCAQARSYQVRTGRFTGEDPIFAGLYEPQQWNRYAYAINNPLSFTDYTGLQAQEVITVTPVCKADSGNGQPRVSCPGAYTVTVVAKAPVDPFSLATAIAMTLSQPSQPSSTPGPDWASIFANRTFPGQVISSITKAAAPNSSKQERAEGALDIVLTAVPPARAAKSALPPSLKKELAAAALRYPSKVSKVEKHHEIPIYLGGEILKDARSNFLPCIIN